LTDPVVSLAGVTKRFGDFVAVEDLSFALPRGAIVGFLGPNGAGKTTTVRMMLGILPPDSGHIEIFGRPSTRALRERIGYLPEERGLYRRLRTIDAIVYIALLKGMNGGVARRRGLALLEQFGLSDFARVRIQGLSKGMSQKVQVIASIIHDPEFVILDEPFSGLDPVNQAELEVVVNNLARDGKTVLFSTHTMEHAERLCDGLVIIAKGRKLFDGTPDEARELLPRRALIEAAEDLSFLAQVKGVVRVAGPPAGSSLWEIELAPGADGRSLLAACFERGVVPAHFEIARPTLREVFVSLVGAGEHEHGRSAA
jgi:ABC-2 type transport system ATP-binding protein